MSLSKLPTHACSICTDLFRKPRGEILLEQVRVVAFGDIGVAPEGVRPMSVSVCHMITVASRRAAHGLT